MFMFGLQRARETGIRRGLFFLFTLWPVSYTYSSSNFATQRNRTAANLLQRYNASYQLLAGAHAGGKGFQPNGFSIIDENYLAAKALHPYNPLMAAAISSSVAYWLKMPGAGGWRQDRRQNLWGNRTCARVGAEACAVHGSFTPDPPLAGVNVVDTPFAVYSELNNNVTFTVESCARANGLNVNHCVPLLLAHHLGGDDYNASRIFKRLANSWDGIGFGPPKPPPQAPVRFVGGPNNTEGGGDGSGVVRGGCRTRFDALYTTRSIGYFLIAQRALAGRPGFTIQTTVLDEIEAALWRLQRCDADGSGLPAAYNAAGEPCCDDNNGSMTSIETGAISLLAYDARVRTVWFPASRRSVQIIGD